MLKRCKEVELLTEAVKRAVDNFSVTDTKLTV